MIIGFDGEIAPGEARFMEMFGVTDGVPVGKVVNAFWHARDKLEQHHRLVEVIQVIGRQQGLFINIGSLGRGTDHFDPVAAHGPFHDLPHLANVDIPKPKEI